MEERFLCLLCLRSAAQPVFGKKWNLNSLRRETCCLNIADYNGHLPYCSRIQNTKYIYFFNVYIPLENSTGTVFNSKRNKSNSYTWREHGCPGAQNLLPSCNNIVNVPPDVLTKPNHLPILLQLSCKLWYHSWARHADAPDFSSLYE
jgi:hypothetical protein